MSDAPHCERLLRLALRAGILATRNVIDAGIQRVMKPYLEAMVA